MRPDPAPPSVSPRDGAWVAASALLPAIVAGAHLSLYGSGGRDAGVIGAVGLGYAGGFRALDAWIAAPFAALPLGTRVLRAELAGAMLVAMVASLTFVLLRRMLVAVAGRTGWVSIVAAVATATASLSYPLQHEAMNAASGLAGVVLVLAALVLVESAAPSPPLLSGLCTLALSYEPAVGVCVAVAVAAGLWSRPRKASSIETGEPVPHRRRLRLAAECLAAAILGLAPFVLATLHARVTPLSTSARALASPVGPAPASGALSMAAALRHALGLFRAELGEVLLLLAATGLVWSLVATRPRRAVLPLAAVTATACVGCVMACAAASPALPVWRPVGLVALTCVVIFAGVTMHEAVLRVARAKVPLASASASMVVLLEAAFPTILLDDGLTRSSGSSLAIPAWEDTAFSGLPGGAVVLVSAPRLYARLLATEAAGGLPDDLGLIPTFDPSNEGAAAALAHDTRLVPLFRDIVLGGVPGELSMSTLASIRPLTVAADPRWDRTLSRHLIPGGLLASFEPEPRGGADRKRALEASATSRTWLAKALGSPGAVTDAPLASLTESMLLDRALGAAQTGEREVALRAIDDAASFAPQDPRVLRLMAAEAAANAKSSVDAPDLVREGLAAEAP